MVDASVLKIQQIKFLLQDHSIHLDKIICALNLQINTNITHKNTNINTNINLTE